MNKFTSEYPVLFFLLFICHVSFAQQTTLSGAIVIDRTEVMSYSIVFELNRDNTFTGYSISDKDGVEETRAAVSGKYNPKENSLHFEETRIESTRSKTPASEFCLMTVDGKFDKKGKGAVFTGKFTSYNPNPVIICASGTIMMMAEEKLEELSAKTSKSLAKLPPSGSEKSEQPTPEEMAGWKRNLIEVEAGSVTELKLASSKLQIDLVDDRFPDGDKITILKNDERVVSGLTITNKVQSFSFDIPKNANEIAFTFIAEDEGSIALTTLRAFFRNGPENNMVMSSLNKGQSVKVVLKR